MNPIKPILACLLLAAAGCVTEDRVVTDPTPRAPTTAVDVYADGQTPTRSTKVIAELSMLGPREEELKARKRFLSQARAMGGQAILTDVVPAGQRGGMAIGPSGGIGGTSAAWVFRAKVLVYE